MSIESSCWSRLFNRKNQQVSIERTTYIQSILDVKEQLHLASEFVANLPVPICLIDKKGFLHYTNPEFDNLISIQLIDEHFPYIGRFFISHTFRQCIDELSASPSVVQLKLRIEWIQSLVKDAEALTLYEWILSGSSLSEAVVITGRRNSEADIERKRTIGGDVHQESLIKIEKYRRSLVQRELRVGKNHAIDLQSSPLEGTINQNWKEFMKRAKHKELIATQMKGIGDVMDAISAKS
jgi:hypothetical protein